VLAPQRDASRAAPAAATAGAPAAANASTPSAAIPEKSIAVLPFENLSDDKANAYFAEGMQDEILTRLAGIADLKVISRTSTKRYASRPDNLKIVAAELGAAHILEGSVQKAGDAVRVNVQLIDARSDTHLWAQTYDRELKNVFAVESEVAQQIADVLKARMSPQETSALAKAPTENAEAYDHYLRAEFQAHRAQETFEDVDFLAADSEYRQAIAQDSTFAAAYARVADNQLARHWFTRRLSAAELAQVKTWIDRAIELAPDLPAAHSALGYFHYWGLREFDAAIAQFQVVLELAPNNVNAIQGIGFIERRLGRWPEAVASLQRAITSSPRDGTLIGEYGTTLVLLRRHAEAEAQLTRVRTIDPEDTNSRDFLLRNRLFGFGDAAAARAAFEPPPAWRISYHNLLAGDLFQLVNARVYPDLFERRFDAALQQWDSAPQNTDEERLTRRVARVAIQVIAGRRSSIQSECAVLAPLLAAQAQQQPDSLSGLQQTSWVDVCLGRNAEAIAAARRATELLPLAKDQYFGIYQLEGLAEIDAQAGAPDEAIKRLEQLLALPAGQSVTVERLKRDPLWDPLRKDPRFQKLLADARKTTGNKP
jgi:TolB-like protein